MKDINRCNMETCYGRIILGNNVLKQCNSFAIIGSLRAFNMQMYILNLWFQIFFFFWFLTPIWARILSYYLNISKTPGFVEDILGKGEGFLLTRVEYYSFHFTWSTAFLYCFFLLAIWSHQVFSKISSVFCHFGFH